MVNSAPACCSQPPGDGVNAGRNLSPQSKDTVWREDIIQEGRDFCSLAHPPTTMERCSQLLMKELSAEMPPSHAGPSLSLPANAPASISF